MILLLINCLVLDPKAKHKIDFNIFNTSNIKGFTLSRGLLVCLSVFSMINLRSFVDYNISVYVIPYFNKHSGELTEIFNHISRNLPSLGRNFNFKKVKNIPMFISLKKFWVYPSSNQLRAVSSLPVGIIVLEIQQLNDIIPVNRGDEMGEPNKLAAYIFGLRYADLRIDRIFGEALWRARRQRDNAEIQRIIADVNTIKNHYAFRRLEAHRDNLKNNVLNNRRRGVIAAGNMGDRLNRGERDKYRNQ